MSFESNHFYNFREFKLDVGETVLLKNGEQVPITPKAFRLLCVLVEHKGSVVQKDQLLAEIWPDSFVEEGNLAFTARLLRKALDDDARNPTFIETVPRKGYRFIADVATEPPEPEGPMAIDPAATRRATLFAPRITSLLATLVILTAVALLYINLTAESSSSSVPLLTIPFSAERLTSSGDAAHAAISPDGRLVAYTDQANDKWSIWLKQLSTSENIQIVPPGDVRYAGLAFSHDGNSLFFVRGDLSGRTLDIYRIGTFGGIPQRLVENTQGWISLSPDDKQISFVRCYYARADYCSLFVSDIDGKNERVVVTRQEPVRIADNEFSPDGKSIAFAAGQSRTGSDDFGIFRIDLQSGEETELVSRRFFNIKSLRWLPDSSGLMMTARNSRSHKFSIWNVSTRTGDAAQITDDDANFSGLNLDARAQLMVATKVDNDFGIFHEQHGDPTSRKFLTPGTEVSLASNGTIVYSSPDREIWRIGTDGMDKRQLTSDPGTDLGPFVSPDDRTIFFTSNRSGVNHIWRMNADGSDQRQLTQVLGGFARFVTPDGEWLFYKVDRTDQYRKVRTDGTDEQDAPEINASVEAFAPDGMSVAYFIRRSASGQRGSSICIQGLNANRECAIVDIGDEDTDPIRLEWSSDGGSLLYLARIAGKISLWRVPIAKPAPQLVADLGSDPIERVVVDNNGKSILTVRGKWTHDAFLIRGLKR